MYTVDERRLREPPNCGDKMRPFRILCLKSSRWIEFFLNGMQVSLN